MEHGNNEKQEQTDKSERKLGNKRKRKRVESLKVHLSFLLYLFFLFSTKIPLILTNTGTSIQEIWIKCYICAINIGFLFITESIRLIFKT